MQTKWIEELIALSHTGSLTQAAERRHVTHPAFGRRIRAQAWADAPLIERRGTSVKLTFPGEKLLGLALQVVPAMAQARWKIAEAIMTVAIVLHPANGAPVGWERSDRVAEFLVYQSARA